jgi:hypothetical protein
MRWSECGGSVLADQGPVGGLSFTGEAASAARHAVRNDWPPTKASYVICAETARRVGAPLDDAPATETPEVGEVVFGPGSRFLVLMAAEATRARPLSRCCASSRATAGPAGNEAVQTPSVDRLALTRLDELVQADRVGPAGAGSSSWPPHCLGPIGGPTAVSSP